MGSRKEEVIGFIDSLTIAGLKPEHHGYIPDVADATIPWEGPAIVTGGHINATIRNASRDDRQLQVYNIYMEFRFDSKERLVSYKVQTLGDW
jgi:hypothetical protein